MPKAVGQRSQPAAARANQQQAAVAPARECSGCEHFESQDRGFGTCHRYPQTVTRKGVDRACGEFSEK